MTKRDFIKRAMMGGAVLCFLPLSRTVASMTTPPEETEGHFHIKPLPNHSYPESMKPLFNGRKFYNPTEIRSALRTHRLPVKIERVVEPPPGISTTLSK